jgi:FeS assembly SUF system regulator
MLRISKMADYAVVILHCLSADTGALLSASEIARQAHLGRHTASKVLKMLQAADLVTSTRGAEGGYSLTQLPAQITLAQIIMALEGPLAFMECAHPTQRCIQNDTCNLKHNWKTINQFIVNTLHSISLADMQTPLSLSHTLKKI